MKRWPMILMMMGLLVFCIKTFDQYQERAFNRMWAEDFNYIIETLEKMHPNPYKKRSKESVRIAFHDLRAAADKMTEEEVIFQTMKIIASLEDGHTTVTLDNFDNSYMYPMRFRTIGDRVYLVKTSEAYQDYLYAQVIAINNIPMADIITRGLQACSGENDQFRIACLEYFLYYERFLYHLGVTEERAPLDLALIKDGREDSLVIEAMDREAFNKMAMDQMVPLQGYGVANYSYQYYPDHKTLVFKYTACFEDETMSMNHFNDAFWLFTQLNPVDKVVLDVSRNFGGDPDLLKAFFNSLSLSDYNAPNKGFVIIGKENYSAGTLAASKVHRLTDVTLVGEPTGGAPVMTFGPEAYTTPNHEIKFYVASGEFENYPNYDHDSIMPDVMTPMTIEDYQYKRNPALTYIFNQ